MVLQEFASFILQHLSALVASLGQDALEIEFLVAWQGIAQVETPDNHVRNFLFLLGIAHIEWSELEGLAVPNVRENLIVWRIFNDSVVTHFGADLLFGPISHGLNTKLLVGIDFLGIPALSLVNWNALEISANILLNEDLFILWHEVHLFKKWRATINTDENNQDDNSNNE